SSLLCGILAGVLGLAPLAAGAQPSDRPLSFVVPYPAGGVADLVARLLAEPLKAELGRDIIVENRPGGGTIIATQYALRQPPGDALLLVAPALAVNTALYQSLPYDTEKDLLSVVDLTVGPLV